MEIIKYPTKEKWTEILKRPVFDTRSLDNTVQNILDEIKSTGDIAIKKYTKKFDGVNLQDIEVSKESIITAYKQVPEELKKAINLAIKNIKKFHLAQKSDTKIVTTTDGVKCWQKSVAIEKVGLYVPGGTAPLFSTVLMLGIPAKIAGCKEIILCSPPDENGDLPPSILYAANEIGINKIFKIGGIQAIGAMTYGSETVPKVYKIFGPGNQYVTAAKQLVSREDVAIDLPAGPSEVAIMADEYSNPKFIAADMLSQAEHGIDSQAILVTNAETIIDSVVREVENQLKDLPRQKIAEKALMNSKIILVNDKNEMLSIINEYAPEHLIISTDDYNTLSEKIINAGSIFLGQLTPESAGDYASGTNHTLPTNGYAKMYNGVNLDDYVKKITFQEIDKNGLENIGPAIEIMAETEELIAHKNAVTLRLNSIKK